MDNMNNASSPILNWVDVDQSCIVKFLTWQQLRIYISKTVFPTPVYSGKLEFLLTIKIVP